MSRLRAVWTRAAGGFQWDAYHWAGLAILLVTVVYRWRSYVRKHEAIYLLGPRSVAEPGFLEGDLSWSDLPPTTWLYDHGMAPVWSALGDVDTMIVGRLVTWVLLAGGLAALARALRLPPWSAVVGYAGWLLWTQTIVSCGAPLDGFQPKSFAYPLIFFSLAFALRGQVVGAGLAAGLATAFHIIVGGWACLALFLSMALDRSRFSLRDLAHFLLATSPFIVPLVLSVALFHSGGVSGAEQASMDEIYVVFAQPHCLDPEFFMSDDRWMRVFVVFPVSLLLAFAWRERQAARLLGGFLVFLMVWFGLGLIARPLEMYTFLKLYPFQLANGLPALFLFLLAFGHVGRLREAGTGRVLSAVAAAAGALAFVWLFIEREVVPDRIAKVQRKLVEAIETEEWNLYGRDVNAKKRRVYAWIREHTDRRSIFVTPYLPEFWTYAARVQVAAFRHPPHDRRLIEWKTRLEVLNQFQPFQDRGFDIRDEIDDGQAWLSVEDLVFMRERYGATHYFCRRRRDDLADRLLFAVDPYHVYWIGDLVSGE